MTVALTRRWLPELPSMPWLDELRASHVALIDKLEEERARPVALRRRHGSEDEIYRAAVRKAIARGGAMPARSPAESDEVRRAELALAEEALAEVSDRLARFVGSAVVCVRGYADELHPLSDRQLLMWPGDAAAGSQSTWLREAREAAQLIHDTRPASRLVIETAQALRVSEPVMSRLEAVVVGGAA